MVNSSPVNRLVFQTSSALLVLLLLFKCNSTNGASELDHGELAIKMPTEKEELGEDGDEIGTRWAVLVAGSSGYENYRHQADVCHAYQVLKKGGLKEENIVVFMYDDIAYNESNPRPGVIINHPQGSDVYAGVPKDYTGEHVTGKNLFAVLLGDKSSVTGGSGKVVDSKPNDRIFLYYTDHGAPGVIGMPNKPYVYADEFIEVLKKKHASGTYKEMVIYLESCESGTMFEGLLPENLNIYATTAANAEEMCWASYCPGMEPPPPPEFDVCLGDLYSVAWMEDSENHNLKNETIQQQYQAVKDRTSNYTTYSIGSIVYDINGSHVMEYGNKHIKSEKLYLYQGFNPDSTDITWTPNTVRKKMEVVNQREADLMFLWQKYKRSENGSKKKTEIMNLIRETLMHRTRIDGSVELIGLLLFGPGRGTSILNAVRPSSSPLVDDWSCLKAMIQLFESHCGSLTQYGMKHTRAFANICNSGISQDAMESACMEACKGHHSRLLCL